MACASVIESDRYLTLFENGPQAINLPKIPVASCVIFYRAIFPKKWRRKSTEGSYFGGLGLGALSFAWAWTHLFLSSSFPFPLFAFNSVVVRVLSTVDLPRHILGGRRRRPPDGYLRRWTRHDESPGLHYAHLCSRRRHRLQHPQRESSK